MDKQEVLNRIDYRSFYESFIPSLKENGKAEAIGLCPFHDDHHPSLSINLSSGLYNCLAGCGGGDAFNFYQRLKGTDFPTALSEIAEMVGIMDTPRGKVVARFEYRNNEGNVLYIKERIEPGRNGRDKDFRFKHLEGDKWVLNRGHDPVLYNLPEVIKSKYVILTEGEAKADLLMKWGLVATCLDSGANSPFRDDYLQYLEGKEKVVILPDNDTPGRRYASRIASALHGKAGELKVVEPPGLKEAEDIIDWARIKGNDKEKLIELIKQAPEWQPDKTTYQTSMPLTRLSDLFKEPEENVSWLVDGVLPSGGFSVLASKPKVGKSTLARNLALNVARGESFLDKKTSKGPVIYYALEEKKAEVRKHFRDMEAQGEEDIYIYAGGAPIDALKQIREIAEDIKPVLIIIDPLFRLAKVKDGNDYAQVTQALDPLLRLARDSGTHVLCVHHTNKGDRQGGDSVLGSTAIFSSVDTLLLMRRLENYRTIQTIQRYGEDLEETTLHFDKDTRTIEIGKPKFEEDIEGFKKAIIEFLSLQSESTIKSVIMEEVEGRAVLKRKALMELVTEGMVIREGEGGKGDPFKYSMSLCPNIYRDTLTQNPENDVTVDNYKANGMSQKNAVFSENVKTPDIPFSGKKQEVIDLTNVDFEVIE